MQEIHDAVPPTHADTTEKLCKLMKCIAMDSSEASIDKIRNDLKEISDFVDSTESSFISDMMKFVIQGCDSSAVDWSSLLKTDPAVRKKFLNFLDSPDSLQLLARIHVIKTYRLLGKNADGAPIDDEVKYLIAHFETPLRFYNEIVRRIVMSGCNLTKKNRSNWIWDIQISFNIGLSHNINGRNVRLVTSDNDILDASQKAHCGSVVYSLKDYTKKLDKRTIA